MKFIDTLLVVVAGIIAVVCSRAGLFTPSLVFGILAVVSACLPLKSRYKMIMVTAFGLSLILFVSSLIAGGVIMYLVVLAVLMVGRLQITVKMLGFCLIPAIIVGLIIGIGNVVLGGLLIFGMIVLAVYCIFVRIHRMNKPHQVKVD